MDRPGYCDRLGVNKIGKNIKKSSLHESSSSHVIGIASSTPQSQPQVSNIRKNHQQITGSPLHQTLPQPPLLPLNPPKTYQNTCLQKIRPEALAQINRPHVSPPVMAQPTHDLAARLPMHPLQHGYTAVESPVSAYLQSSLAVSIPNENQMQQSHEVKGQAQLHRQFNGSASSMAILPTPRFNGPPQQMYSNSLPSPRFNGRGILPSPTSENLLQRAYQNLLSSNSPHSLLSPGVRYLPPHTPRSSALSSMGQPGILGPGTIPQPPASPGLVFSSSPYVSRPK